MAKQNDQPSLKIEEIRLVDGSCTSCEVLLHINNVHMATVRYEYGSEISEIFIKLSDVHFADNYYQRSFDSGNLKTGITQAKKIIAQWFAVLGIEVS